MRALERPPARTDEPWRPWLVRVAMNLARDLLRRRRRSPYRGTWLPSPIETGADDAPPAYEIPAESGSPTEGRYELLESVSFAFLLALEALTPSQRAVLLLRDVFDYSVRETADALGMSEANVKVTHHRARRAMAAYDRDRCVPTARRCRRAPARRSSASWPRSPATTRRPWRRCSPRTCAISATAASTPPRTARSWAATGSRACSSASTGGSGHARVVQRADAQRPAGDAHRLRRPRPALRAARRRARRRRPRRTHHRRARRARLAQADGVRFGSETLSLARPLPSRNPAGARGRRACRVAQRPISAPPPHQDRPGRKEFD